MLHQRYVDYWSNAINSNVGDPKALWSQINLLLKAAQASTTTTHTADDFSVHFRSKVDVICKPTLVAPPPEIISQQCPSLSLLQEVTVEEIVKIISLALAKHCQLDIFVSAECSHIGQGIILFSYKFSEFCLASGQDSFASDNKNHSFANSFGSQAQRRLWRSVCCLCWPPRSQTWSTHHSRKVSFLTFSNTPSFDHD